MLKVAQVSDLKSFAWSCSAMRTAITSGLRPFLFGALGLSLLALASCDSSLGCCPENGSISYALIYGTVRTADGHGAAGAQVFSDVNDRMVTTDTTGAYRFLLAFPLLGPGAQQTGVHVVPANYTPGVDSVARVSFTVQAFATEHVEDSTRVDVTLPGTP
jgi:hypothetical protein